MWFNNVLVFQYEFEQMSDLSTLLANELLKPCPPHARFIYGWLPACMDEMAQEVAGSVLFCMGKEERILPRGVITRVLTERVQAWETQQGRSMKRAERAQLAEELEFELLPKSFCLQKKLFAFFDTVSQHLIINSASHTQASQLTSLLRKTLPGIKIEPLEHSENLAFQFTNWIQNPVMLPSTFQLASDCALIALDDEKKRFSCKGCELPSEEVLTLLSQGLSVTEISIIWNERIQFTLTQDFTLKRMKCLDYLVEEFHEIRNLDEEYQQQDATLTLLSGELRGLIKDLLSLTNMDGSLLNADRLSQDQPNLSV